MARKDIDFVDINTKAPKSLGHKNNYSKFKKQTRYKRYLEK